MSSFPRSIWARKADLLYLAFFVIHIPIIFIVDAVPLYPISWTPPLLLEIRNFYIETYHDKFFEPNPPAWFLTYILMELFYHVPLSVWAIDAFLKDSPLVPLHILVWAVQTFLTTWTCLFEVWSWADRTYDQKVQISMLYGPYVALAGVMALDMFSRLRRQILIGQRVPKKEL